MPSGPLDILIYSLLAFVIGLGCLISVRRLDRKNYIIQKATPLPLALVNERDDVWLKGSTECGSPLSGPHFELPCLYYEYELEERVTRLRRNSKGRLRVKREWKTREKSSKATGFFLRDGEHKIHIDGSAAEFRDHETKVVRVGDWRHTLDYIPHPSELNAIGNVSEGKERLETHANIPLIVTTKDREVFVQEAERKEAWTRRIGFPLFWAGMVGLFSHVLETPGLAPGLATAIVVLYWGIFKYNTLVAYRNRVDNAWHQIDVDLSMRYELIPKLVESVKGFMEHERQLMETLVGIRNQASTSRENKLSLEGDVAKSVNRTIVRIESYPDLKAQGTTFKLTRQIRAIEEKIAHGRSFYNEVVREYNDNVQMFPQALIATQFGFAEHTFFSVPEGKARMPDVDL